MNELRRNGKRTREQLTFSDTYLVLDNLRNYDFDLVSFYVTFNQYIDRRNYEGENANTLIFKNNESLFKAFNVSRNRFYRLLKLAYECGLIDIEKGNCNRNIYILNDTVPFKPLNKIRKWEDREGAEAEMGEDVNKENKVDIFKTGSEEREEIILEEFEKETPEEGKCDVKSYPKKGQPRQRQPVVPKRDNQLSQKRTTSYPEKVQASNHVFTDNFNVLDSAENTSNNSNILIDLNFNNQSIRQSIDLRNIRLNENAKTDRLTNIPFQFMDKYKKTISKCELYAIEEKYRDAAAHAIKLLFLDIENNRRINIGDNIIPAEIIEKDMENLNFFVIEHAVNKFKEASREKKIRNTVGYLKACIYNSIHDIKLDVDAELRYKGFTT